MGTSNPLKPMYDEVIRRMSERLTARARESFAIFVAGLAVRRAFEPEYKYLPKIQQREDEVSFYLTFTAMPTSGRFTYTLRVQVARKGNSSKYRVEKALIYWCGKWIGFDAFLDSLVDVPPLHVPVGTEGYEALFRWYTHREKPFRLLDLPRELRMIVFQFAIGDDIYPQVLVKEDSAGMDRFTIGTGWIPSAPTPRLKNTHDPLDEVPPPNTALLLVNRLIKDEVHRFVWRSGRQSFSNPAMLDAIAKNLKVFPTNALRNIGLNFTNGWYLLFFGASGVPSEDNKAPAWILQEFPNLKNLSIKFRSPRWEPFENPWTRRILHNRGWEGEDPDNLNFNAQAYPPPCQKTITTMALGLALEHVRHIEHVDLEGYIKDSTKERFNKALRMWKESPEKKPEWEFSKEDVARAVGNARPPACSCTKKCGFWGVYVLYDPGRPSGRPAEEPQAIFAKYRFNYDD